VPPFAEINNNLKIIIMATKFYRRKIDNGTANQVISIKDGIFQRIAFEETGNGYHKGFVPNTFEVDKKMQRGFLKRYGFKEFKPSDNFMDSWTEDIIQEEEIKNSL
jgi:hypothetical protein